ncbi:DUF3159 domain-containing protein [Glutamicibacter sp. MNS18]|uniref:DUF3159 domain-containing protein n=1 Tax=Glutamicibacter sp. MNS18 TaxID=2989817 RepID=UPI0022367D3E|nr:DUF3159 domain-containing protein [Glutamicibacter sp. MNS18]MCW4464471.1 DUF3159 domain-containing protein [Glutamicibacter sp. MNS18]
MKHNPEPEDQHSDREPEPSLAERLGSSTHLSKTASGQIDVMASIGGLRGVIETVLPGFLFVLLFALTGELDTALIAAVVVGVVFMVLRLAKRSTLTQSISGLVGILICAFAARSTGEAKDYYVPGFFIVAAYLLALLVSIMIKWPLVGVLYGFLRQEGTEWRKDAARLKRYNVATWILVGVFAARLAVQLPLYFTDQVVALGISRLVMGVPLYAAGLWFAWMISRPAAPSADRVQGP